MNEDIDIEEVLNRYGNDPSVRVKRSVMSRFIRTLGNRGSSKGRIRFWHRPVPLYLATALVVIAVGLTSFIGRKIMPQEQRPGVRHESVQENDITATRELKWEVAHSDFL